MSIVYLLILAAIAAVFLIFARKKSCGGKELVEKTKAGGERVICVYDMDKERLQNTIDEFIGLYSDNGDVERPKVKSDGKVFRLFFSPALGYVSMCYWVNYLVYADESRKSRYTVRGWYPFGEVLQNEELLTISNQTVMLYVDKDDRTYDNVSLVTPDGHHYLQPFAVAGNLRPVAKGSEDYRPVAQ
ncbi:MAG: hypothetical protein K6F72_05545 [Bacteroidales bacterium]|nr:hypothetical protein [Bacteroidales bacterium]